MKQSLTMVSVSLVSAMVLISADCAAQLTEVIDDSGNAYAVGQVGGSSFVILPDGTRLSVTGTSERRSGDAPSGPKASIALAASTLMVKQHGAGDATTIQGGIDLAVAGDTVEVYPGVYFEQIVIDKDITVKSHAGPRETTIDGLGNGAVVTLEGGISSAATFEGFSVRNGAGDATDAGGIAVIFSSPTVRGNRVYWNTSHGMSARGAGTPMFSRNLVAANTGSGFLNWSSSGSLLGNHFVDNSEAGIQLYNAFPSLIASNVILRNTAGGLSGILPDSSAMLDVRNNTIVDNGTGVVLNSLADQVTMQRNIVGYNKSYGFVCGSPNGLCPTLSENDFWLNVLGAYSGPISAPSDLNVDPEFCGPNDYGLHSTSPCILGGGEVIGALGPGC